MLTKYFEAPHSLRRLRAGGTGHYLDGFAESLWGGRLLVVDGATVSSRGGAPGTFRRRDRRCGRRPERDRARTVREVPSHLHQAQARALRRRRGGGPVVLALSPRDRGGTARLGAPEIRRTAAPALVWRVDGAASRRHIVDTIRLRACALAVCRGRWRGSTDVRRNWGP